jgi:hypothetical protein
VLWYDSILMDETLDTTKCPICGFENKPGARYCASPTTCGAYLKSEVECLRSIDGMSAMLVKIRNDTEEAASSLKAIKRIAILWLVLSILGAVIFALSRA